MMSFSPFDHFTSPCHLIISLTGISSEFMQGGGVGGRSQRGQSFSHARPVSPRDLLCSLVPRVNSVVLDTWHFAKRFDLM